MAERWDLLEADFAIYYQADLRAALWGPRSIGCRRLIALITGLPAAARTWDRDRDRARAVSEPDPTTTTVTPSEFAGLMSNRRR